MPIVYIPVGAHWGRGLVAEMIAHRIYAIEYASGLLKVGRTRDMPARWINYRWNARKVGDPITRAWFSCGQLNATTNESALIKFCTGRWRLKPGHREFFLDGDFDRTREFADSLNYERIPDESLDEHQLMSSLRAEAFAASLPFDQVTDLATAKGENT